MRYTWLLLSGILIRQAIFAAMSQNVLGLEKRGPELADNDVRKVIQWRKL